MATTKTPDVELKLMAALAASNVPWSSAPGGLPTKELFKLAPGNFDYTIMQLHRKKFVFQLRVDGSHKFLWYLTQRGLDELHPFTKC